MRLLASLNLGLSCPHKVVGLHRPFTDGELLHMESLHDIDIAVYAQQSLRDQRVCNAFPALRLNPDVSVLGCGFSQAVSIYASLSTDQRASRGSFFW